jgi:hypothetical protein
MNVSPAELRGDAGGCGVEHPGADVLRVVVARDPDQSAFARGRAVARTAWATGGTRSRAFATFAAFATDGLFCCNASKTTRYSGMCSFPTAVNPRGQARWFVSSQVRC